MFICCHECKGFENCWTSISIGCCKSILLRDVKPGVVGGKTSILEEARTAAGKMQKELRRKDGLLNDAQSKINLNAIVLNDAQQKINLKDAMIAGANKKPADLTMKYEKQTARMNEKKDEVDWLKTLIPELEEIKKKDKTVLPTPLGTTAKAAPRVGMLFPPKASTLSMASSEALIPTGPPPIPALDSEGRIHKAPRLS